MAFSVRELRAAYPRMPFDEFVRIYEGHKNCNELLDILDMAEAVAASEGEREEEAIAELILQLSASEQHHRLHIAVQSDIDLEHVQAILMYGFIMPGQQRAFMGANMIPDKHVAHNVKNKLGYRFSEKKFRAAFDYLMKEGVFLLRQDSGDLAMSLKTSAKEKGVHPHGAQILRVVIDYLRSKC